MVHLKTLIRKEHITLKEQVIKQLERQEKTMKFNYLVEVTYRDNSIKTKIFNYKEYEQANNYHNRMNSLWGSNIKKVVTKKI